MNNHTGSTFYSIGLQGLHFHIQTINKVASRGGLSRVPETI